MRLLIFMGITCLLMALPLCSLGQARKTNEKHYVFAHYMVCYATYGDRVEDYAREIKEAQAAGIDGFALNVGAWTNEPHYVTRTKAIYQAAKELGTGFKLFFSEDNSNPEYITDMIRTYGHHPNQFTYHNRIVVSTFSQDGLDWKTKVIDPLKKEGFDIFFIPYFYPRFAITELPDYKTVKRLYEQYASLVDGLFYFGAAGTAPQLAASNTAYTRVMKEAGKVVMASFTPYYWGQAQPDRRYFETEGGKGMATQWEGIIKDQPNWVEIVTWNDFNETYLTPIVNPEQYFKELAIPRRYNHAGYYELCKYYIQWYKSGKKPVIKRDGLFYFYRTHAKAAVAGIDKKPATTFHGDVQDALYVTTMLTAPAELRVISGATKHVHKMKAGIQHVSIPFNFSPGAQHFALYRNDKLLCEITGEPVLAKIEYYDFFPASGYVYGQ